LSPLTKTFVIALVFLSLLLTAAAFTFLTTIPNYAQEIDRLETAVAAANAKAAGEVTSANNARSSEQEQAIRLNAQLETARAQVRELQTQLDAALAEAAARQSQVVAANGAMGESSAALAANQQLLATLNEQVNDLRDENNAILVQNSEISRALAQAENELEFVRRAARALEEANADLRSEADNLKVALRNMGVDPAEADGPQFAPRITGRILARVNTSDGQPYATISVGREDDVRENMEFFVIDAETESFLGILTVTDVEDGSAYGLLRGDNIANVTADDSVTTRLSDS
jgi:hypothetical protein